MDKEIGIELAYLERSIEEEHLTLEQFRKILELRNKNVKGTHYNGSKFTLYREIVKEGDSVFFWWRNVNLNKTRLQGYIVKVHDKSALYYKTVDISSALGFFEKVPVYDVWPRIIQDLSYIEIPEELKKISTHRLLNAYKATQRIGNRVWFGLNRYDREVVKAELGTREHIYSKEDKKIIKKSKI